VARVFSSLSLAVGERDQKEEGSLTRLFSSLSLAVRERRKRAA
jgi:hypothetical protein